MNSVFQQHFSWPAGNVRISTALQRSAPPNMIASRSVQTPGAQTQAGIAQAGRTSAGLRQGPSASDKRLTVARAAPRPMGQKASPTKPKGPSAVEGRQLLLDNIPAESFKIAGVSFEGRQDSVSRLQPGETQSNYTASQAADSKGSSHMLHT